MAFIAEALGREEVYAGVALVGPAGEMFNKALRRVGIDRNGVRLHNIISCRPPDNKLVGMPWEYSAIAQCRQYLDPVLMEPHKVFMALGATATRVLLDQPKQGFRINNWHGYPTFHAGRWVVPTFHPSHLLQGQHKLLGTMMFDMQRAKMVAEGSWVADEPELIVDPDYEWFREWAEDLIARSEADPYAIWLVIDTETQQKMTGQAEDELEDEITEIVRINFSTNVGLGITVPWAEPYIALVKRLCQSRTTKIIWNERYDIPILRAHDSPVSEPVLDFMWAWHMLQSDIPRGLGFVAPFYSKAGAWKHLSGLTPGPYAAKDGPQTLRIALGVAAHLQQFGMWESFYRHVYMMDTLVLHPGTEAGIPMSRSRLETFREKLDNEQRRIREEIQQEVPESCRKEKVWKREPDADAGATAVVRREVVQICSTCGANEISKSHNCRMGTGPALYHGEADVHRWVRREPFNPGSRDQVAALVQSKAHRIPGRQKKTATGKISVDKKTVAALYKSTKDRAYKLILDDRAVAKVNGTYAVGALNRLDVNDLLHPESTHVPSTMRLSYIKFNITNVVADRAGLDAIAAGFRYCVVAPSGFKIVELDFSGIEAVLTGWFANDPKYIRLAKLGVHAYLTSHLVKQPADLTLSDEALAEIFSQIKIDHPVPYDRSKRTVHGTSYGMTPIGLVNNYPEYFDRKSATYTQGLLYEVCPRLKIYQEECRQEAVKQGYSGGSRHPFHYRHWFWNIYNYDRKGGHFTLGEDGKRVVAFKPQSTAAGVLFEACLSLYDEDNPLCVRHLGGGLPPIRALIHDSIVALVPDQHVETFYQRAATVMEAPVKQLPCPPEWGIGPYLSIGVEAKVGQNWGAYNDDPEKGPLNMDGMKKVKLNRGVVADTPVRETEGEEEEVWEM